MRRSPQGHVGRSGCLDGGYLARRPDTIPPTGDDAMHAHIGFQSDASVVDDERILDHAPRYQLGSLAAELFGGQRVWTNAFAFDEDPRTPITLALPNWATSRGNGTPFVGHHHVRVCNQLADVRNDQSWPICTRTYKLRQHAAKSD